ncbi:hypothetical protein P7F88_03900 [Vibrio hannami]|uniref:5' nucleotidase, NT5C type n=1 Tax=Vibrio hannami TaxID=2717094 RepID=UPI00240FB97F|nr:hypothetical protein [Vibrio hannami]MDG3085291.1 hypothetical protein [Vibrio hannami]
MLRVYIDMDDVLCEYTRAFEEKQRTFPSVRYPQSQYGFFANLEPVEDAVESAKKLIASEQFDPYILTAPSVYNPMSYTEKRIWIEKHFGLAFCEKLIICSNKGLLMGDVLIDDRAEGKGQELFQGELMQFGTATYPNWRAVMERLNGKAATYN